MSGIVKIHKIETGFELVPRETLQDKRISLQALGLLVNICSYPENWKLHKTELYTRFEKNKRSSIQNAWKELQDAGYVMEKRERDGKKWDYEYAVRLIPFNEKEQKDFLGCCFSTVENGQPKMDSPKPTGKIIHSKDNTHKNITHENITNLSIHKSIKQVIYKHGLNPDQIEVIQEELDGWTDSIHSFKSILLNVLENKPRNFRKYLRQSLMNAESESVNYDVDDVFGEPKEVIPKWMKGEMNNA